MCGCLWACAWMVVVSSMGMETGLPRQCPISIIPQSVIASKNWERLHSQRDFPGILCCFCTAPGLGSMALCASLFPDLLSFHPPFNYPSDLLPRLEVKSLQSCRDPISQARLSSNMLLVFSNTSKPLMVISVSTISHVMLLFASFAFLFSFKNWYFASSWCASNITITAHLYIGSKKMYFAL